MSRIPWRKVETVGTIVVAVVLIGWIASQVETVSQAPQEGPWASQTLEALGRGPQEDAGARPQDQESSRQAANTSAGTHARERTPTLTPLVVTPEPPAANIFEAATRVILKTAEALTNGTGTPTPPNLVTATYTPRPVVVTNTPAPANAATAEFLSAMATARALTTGTPTPVRAAWVVATNTPAPTLAPIATERPTATPRPTDTPVPPEPPDTPVPSDTATPVLIPLAELRAKPAATPTAPLEFPSALVGMILFKSDMTGREQTFALQPDGSGVAMLTNQRPYEYAEAREPVSRNGLYHAFNAREEAGRRLYQIYYRDSAAGVVRQTTFFGDGTAWAPAWSPTDDLIAFVSSESGNDEIWVARKDTQPAIQLTHNSWEWDHHPSWSPDGRQILFSSNRGGRQQLWIMNADGTEQRPLTDGTFEAWDPIWVK